MEFVIGSGPAGTAAAAALLDLGVSVTMLDAGGTLEPDRAARVAEMAKRPPEAWRPREHEFLQGPLQYNAEGVPLKLAYGSDYVYRDLNRWQPVDTRGVDAYRSLATGGLSVLWGAAIMPFSDSDFADWPLAAREMHEHYAAVLTMTGLAAEHDALDQLYPLHVSPTTSVPLSEQAGSMLSRAESHREQLERSHIHVGRARLALTSPTGVADGCVRCGLCLYGCPYGIIYSTARTIQQLQVAHGSRFVYTPGVIVRRVRETADGVTVDAISRDTQTPLRFDGARAYLGAGTFASTTILLRSLPRPPASITFRQSDHFLMPLWLTGSGSGASRESVHTLSQLFIELMAPAVSRHNVHLQVYTRNDLYGRMARQRLGVLYGLAAPLVERIVDQLALVKGYLHSEESAAIRGTLESKGDGDVLRLSAVRNPRTAHIVRRVASLLRQHGSRLAAWPIPFAGRTGLPGSSAHVGGSFPMRRTPSDLESDVLGRPAGMRRLHVVDASVFPTMPAPSPTLTVMANARRIAVWTHRPSENAACSV